MKNIFQILIVLFISLSVYSQRLSEVESDYFDASKIGSNAVEITLSGNNDGVDSDTLNSAIKDLSNNGGGILTINKVSGKDYIYLRNVNLDDNVHIKIASDVIIRPWYGGNRPKNIIIFGIGKSVPVKNVAVTNFLEDSTNSSEYFTVELPGGDEERVKFLEIKSAYNFKVSGIKFLDSQTVFSNIECNLPNDQSREEGMLPSYGVVKNVLSYKNHVGYGVVQIRAGKNILFKNLDGEGGITLRIESGIPAVIESSVATINNVVGRNLIIRNGDAATVLSPHRINQGKIDVSGIQAYNSTNAIQLAAGFKDKKGGIDNFGTFSSDSYIDNITNVSGGFGAQVKDKDIPFYPCNIQQEIYDAKGNDSGGESTIGKSLTVIRYNADAINGKCINGCYLIKLTLPNRANVSGTALGKDKMIVHQDKDNISGCGLNVKKKKKKKNF
jgi:hypothetical protein